MEKPTTQVRLRLAPATTFEELATRVRRLARELRARGYDELSDEVLVQLEGDDPEDDVDVYGRRLERGSA